MIYKNISQNRNIIYSTQKTLCGFKSRNILFSRGMPGFRTTSANKYATFTVYAESM